MRLAIWSPLPPSSSGVADYVAEVLPGLARRFEVSLLCESPEAVDPALATAYPVHPASAPPETDLDLYHLGNSPAHAFVYRRTLTHPGVVVLHDWSLHHLVLHETVERGDLSTYMREMRRAHGETGTFVARQVSRALGGDLLPSLLPLNDRVLESSLAVVGLSRQLCARAARRLPGRPILHLPHHVALPLDPLPSQEAARRHLGLGLSDFIVTAPGLATAAKRLDVAVRVVSRLAREEPRLRLLIAGDVDPRLPLADWTHVLGDRLVVTGRLGLEDFVRHLCASDVVLSLRFPSHGEMSGALVRALGVGRPVLVSAGTPAAEEFPEGVIAPVDCGPLEEPHLLALLRHLVSSPETRERMGRLAREHVLHHHDLASTVDRLAAFLIEVESGKEAALRQLKADATHEGGLLGFLMEEVRWGARDLGVPGLRLGLGPLLDELVLSPRNSRPG